MVTETIFPSGRARAPTSGLPVSPTRSPLRWTPPGVDNAPWSECLRMTPRVDPKQLRPPTGWTAVRTRASAQAPSPRAPAQARRDFGPGDHLICGRKRSPRSRQPRLTPARLSRRATGPLLGEVQTLGCPPRVTVDASATTPAPAPADAPHPAPAECTIRTNCKSLVLVTPSSWDRLIWHRAPAPRHGLRPPHLRPSFPPWLTTRDRWEFRSSDRPMH